MAKSYFTTHIQVLKTQIPFKLHTIIYITNIIIHSFILPFTSTMPITPIIQNIIFHQMIQILQTLWFLITTVRNNIILDNSIY